MKIDNIFSSRYLIRKGLLDFIEESLVAGSFGVVVDVGAGKAPYRYLINCQKYIGIDIERRADVENLIIADINVSLPLDTESVDLVIMTEVLEHLREPLVGIREVRRILKPGGKIILTTPLLWPIHEEPNDYQRYIKYGLSNILNQAGFKDIRVTGLGNYVLSQIILFEFPLRKKVFIPIVFILNIFGLVFTKFRPGSSVFVISNYVTAIK